MGATERSYRTIGGIPLRRPGRTPRIDAVAVHGDRGVAFGGDGGATSHLWVRDGASGGGP